MLEFKKTHFIILVVLILSSVFLISACGFLTSEEIIATSTSPDETYKLEAYIVNGGATTDYSIKVYLLNESSLSGKKLIYNKYHDYNADIQWLDNDTVSINGVVLDLSKGETYDWRNSLRDGNSSNVSETKNVIENG